MSCRSHPIYCQWTFVSAVQPANIPPPQWSTVGLYALACKLLHIFHPTSGRRLSWPVCCTGYCLCRSAIVSADAKHTVWQICQSKDGFHRSIYPWSAQSAATDFAVYSPVYATQSCKSFDDITEAISVELFFWTLNWIVVFIHLILSIAEVVFCHTDGLADYM